MFKNVVQRFLSLPQFVVFEGIEFVPKLIHNGTDDMRLVYEISSVDADSPHKADIDEHGGFDNVPYGGICGFLYLYENISTQADLRRAIISCELWLNEKGIIK